MSSRLPEQREEKPDSRGPYKTRIGAHRHIDTGAYTEALRHMAADDGGNMAD